MGEEIVTIECTGYILDSAVPNPVINSEPVFDSMGKE